MKLRRIYTEVYSKTHARAVIEMMSRLPYAIVINIESIIDNHDWDKTGVTRYVFVNYNNLVTIRESTDKEVKKCSRVTIDTLHKMTKDVDIITIKDVFEKETKVLFLKNGEINVGCLTIPKHKMLKIIQVYEIINNE